MAALGVASCGVRPARHAAAQCGWLGTSAAASQPAGAASHPQHSVPAPAHSVALAAKVRRAHGSPHAVFRQPCARNSPDCVLTACPRLCMHAVRRWDSSGVLLPLDDVRRPLGSPRLPPHVHTFVTHLITIHVLCHASLVRFT
jgi:hypothetical protein